MQELAKKIARSFRPPSHLASVEDVEQQAMVHLIELAAESQPPGVERNAWLYRTGRFRTMDHYRTATNRHRGRNGRQPRHFTPDCYPQDATRLDAAGRVRPPAQVRFIENIGRPDNTAEQNDTARYVRAALSRLDPVEQEAVRMVYLEGLTQDEAAEKLGVSQATVSRRVTKGLEMLYDAVG